MRLRPLLPSALAALVIGCSSGPAPGLARVSPAFDAWARAPETTASWQLPAEGCLPRVPDLTLPASIVPEPEPVARAVALDSVALAAPVSLLNVRAPELSAGVLRVHVAADNPPSLDAASCTLRVFWEGDAHGETAPTPPDEATRRRRETGESHAEWKMDIPVSTGDDAVLAVDGILHCPGVERRLRVSYVGGPGAERRYCALCPGERRSPLERIAGDVESGRLSILLARRGVEARVHDGVLVDACNGRVLLDLPGAGIRSYRILGESHRGLVEAELGAVHHARRAPSLCVDRPFVQSTVHIEPWGVVRAPDRARLAGLLRAAPGLYWVEGPPAAR